MKYCESWLRSWVNPALTIEEIANLLTMAGLEVEELLPVAGTFKGVVVGEVSDIKELTPQLSVCKVKAKQAIIQIVSGAKNLKLGLKVAIAPAGSLVGNVEIKEILIHDHPSQGALCTPYELGLSDKNEEILVLSRDAPIGMAIQDYLQLNDIGLNVSITPNRGDCLSILGLAREVAALSQTPVTYPSKPAVQTEISTKLAVRIHSKSACSRYVGRVIKGVNNNQFETPIWMQERLRRVGARSINPVVDVMNYVMYEMGQPMHAFDLSQIQQKIIVRNAEASEKIILLDGSEKVLEPDTLVIADANEPLAIAGVMGGLNSSVTVNTQDIFLESAFFSPTVVAKQRQFYGLNTESSYRFERGVDPCLQRAAIERATQLILDIVGGQAGPIVEVTTSALPEIPPIYLEKDKIKKVLGMVIPDTQVEKIFKRLSFSFKKLKMGWKVTIPSYRFDLRLPEDLIEEIARLHGYEHIPTHQLTANLRADQTDAKANVLAEIRTALCHQGYQEVINYSFIDKETHQVLFPQQTAYELLNPINADMVIMRTSLLPGLIKTFLYNKSRQQERIRIFEIGQCFLPHGSTFKEEIRLSGLITGTAYSEQWGIPSRLVDFYDLKGDLENALGFYFGKDKFSYLRGNFSILHDGQSAQILIGDKKVGFLGALHPSLSQALDLDAKVFIFEVNLLDLAAVSHPTQFEEISKFPEIRRDIAILIDQAVPAEEIQDTIKTSAGKLLKEVFVFDVYQGKGISSGTKSVALALILQDATRTLVDNEVAELMERVVKTLKGKLGAELRS